MLFNLRKRMLWDVDLPAGENAIFRRFGLILECRGRGDFPQPVPTRCAEHDWPSLPQPLMLRTALHLVTLI